MSDMETIWLVVAGVLGLAVVAFVVYLIVSTARNRPDTGGRHRAPSKKRPHRDTFRTEEAEPEPKKRAAVIVQDDGEPLRAELTSQSLAADWDEPLWLPAHDVSTAAAAARQALDAGVDVVCVRGDSAVDRGVAAVLAGTETPLAFLPGGGDPRADVGVPLVADVPGVSAVEPGVAPEAPGSPSARQTWPEGDPVSDQALAEAMTTALTGQNTRVHVGRAVLAPPASPAPLGEGAVTGAAVADAAVADAAVADAAVADAAVADAAVADAAVADMASADMASADMASADMASADVAVTEAGATAATSPAGAEGTAASEPATGSAPLEVVFLQSLVIGDTVPHTEPALTTRTVAKRLFKGTSFIATVKPDDEEAVTRPARSVAFEIGADRPATADSVGQGLDAYLYASQSVKGWTGVARAMMRKSSRPTPLLVPMRSIAFTLTLDKPADLTIDGLAVGAAHPGESTIVLDRQALVVRR